MGPSPYAFVMEGNYRKLKDNCVYRTFFVDDLRYFCRGLKACYTRYGSLEALFASAMELRFDGADRTSAASSAGAVWDGIALFRETIAQANGGAAKQPVYTKHIADPGSGSACKRLHLALRWLVRKEGPVDMGLWSSISPASLFIPLDLHVGRSARQLGLLEESRKSNDKKAVISLTEKLRELCPEDPVKYDFALFMYR